MEIKESDIDQLLQARSEIDEELQRHKTHQTILFTDIVGSTTYFDRFGDTEGLLLLYRHAALVKDAVLYFKGVVVKTIGDSVMAEFAEPLNAVYAAIEIQRLLFHHNQSLSRSERVQIRIGIHAGIGFRCANDLFGDLVNVAARITKRSGPAQILASQSVMGTIPATEVTFKSLGPVILEGKNEAEELFEVLWMAEEEYDALRCSVTPLSASVEPPSPIRTSRVPQSVRLWFDRFVHSFRTTRWMAAVKAAALIVVYVTIAAGMVSSRADTKQRPHPEYSSAQKPKVTLQPETTEELIITTPPQLVPVVLPESSNAIPDPAVKHAEVAATSILEPLRDNPRPNWLALIETVQIPAGVFMMGNDDSKKEEKPRHQVKLDQFHMSVGEITNRQYLAFLAEESYPRPRDPDFAKNYLLDYPDLPVVNVSYDDALAFCAWASTKFGAVVRLPTEAEWEYAAAADSNGGLFPWGMQNPLEMARFKGNAPPGVRTVAKNEFPPNGFGLYNMSGNVGEWVLDYYSKDYYATSPIRNPKGPTSGGKRSVRGGSWDGDDSSLRVTRRSSRSSDEHSDQVGFRVVVSPATTQLN